MIRVAFLLLLIASLAGCSSGKGTLAELRQVEIVIEEEQSGGSLDKAIESYEQFIEKAKDPKMTPEAIRRLADLKVEKEYGLITDADGPDGSGAESRSPTKIVEKSAPESAKSKKTAKQKDKSTASKRAERQSRGKNRTTAGDSADQAVRKDLPSEADLKRIGTQEAIALYQKLLDDFPEYEQNDQVLYQLSRSYEEQGQTQKAMQVMDRLVKDFPESRYLDEVQFRRAEFFFARRKYSEAESAYGSVVAIGETSDYYPRALYKLGWSLYKQDSYREALHNFFLLLDYKVANNYDFEKGGDDQEEKQVKDTLRIIGQSFSNLGGVDAAIDYFSDYGRKPYADIIYANLAEYYFSKQRYNDAVTTYATFVERNPFHRQSPVFVLRIITINKVSGFPSLVIKAKKLYAGNYGFGASYWKYFNPDDRPKVVEGLKVTLMELASHYHALYQKKQFASKKKANLKEALNWYREFLSSFPMLEEAPKLNYQMAELLLENNMFAEAAREYEKIAYEYPVFAKADEAGFAAVYAYRQHLKQVGEEEKGKVKQDVIRASLKFAEFYPQHKKAPVIFGAAVDELYALKDYKTALSEGKNLLKRFPKAGDDIRRSALLVVAHSAYELKAYGDAEEAYADVLKFLPKNDKSRAGLVDNLVASIYKQGEAENRRKSYKRAAEHFLRVSKVAPQSKLRATADYDGAVALIKVEEWEGAASVLTSFRKLFPKHELQHEVTKKLAFVYSEGGNPGLAAVEFERIVSESSDPELRREALLTAGELYEEVDSPDKAALLYRRYIKEFPKPFVVNFETRNKLAALYNKLGKRSQYFEALREIVEIEAAAGSKQTERSRLIAGEAALILAKPDYDAFITVRLVKPFEKNLQRKQKLMKKVTDAYSRLFDFGVADVTAEATFFLAETYADFSEALLKSERPEGLNALELEQYELALEEQAYPFEEKAIEMHQGNHELVLRGIYNKWIDKSLQKLAVFMPARYAKPEAENREIASMDGYRFENMTLYTIATTEAEAEKVKRKNNSDKSVDSKSSRQKPGAPGRSAQ